MGAEGVNLVGGSGGIFPQKIFKFGGSKMLFSTLVCDMSPKNRPRIRKWQTIEVTIIKTTESKENNSIRRLDVCGWFSWFDCKAMG